MKQPIFKSHVTPVSLSPDSVFILTETGEEMLPARAPALARYLTAGPARASAESAFWHAMGLAPQRASLRKLTISVKTLCALRAGDLRNVLRETGMRVSSKGADFDVWIAGDYLDPALLALQPERPFLLVKPLGHNIWVGPLLRPRVTACLHCLASSLRENRPMQTQLQRIGEVPTVWRAALSSTVDLTYSLAATELAKLVAAGLNPHIESRILAYDTISGEWSSHAVRRRPDCPACGSPQKPQARLRLSSRIKRAGHRTATAQATLAHLADLVSPVTGIIPAIARVSHPYESVLQVYGARYNLPLACLERQKAVIGRPDGSSGKGGSAAAAQVSAIAESIERYSGIWRGAESCVRARLADLGPAAIPPARLLGFSQSQIQARVKWNRTCRPIERIPEPFDETSVIQWVRAWSLTANQPRYVPAAFCYFSYPEPAPYCQADSNGCAAGNNLEEAILHGYYELVERDAAALWWYPRALRPAVDLDSFALPAVDDARLALSRNRRSLHVLDITTDLGVTAFAAITADPTGGRIAIGLAAHLDPAAALAGAVSDAMWQEVVVAVPSARVHPATRRWLAKASLAAHPYLNAGHERRPAAAYTNRASKDILVDLRRSVDFAKRASLEVIALDQTRPETRLAVARVIAPGLRHLWPRFGPGRLYQQKHAPAERDLNPVPFPF